MTQSKLHSSPFQARNSPRGRRGDRGDDSPSRQLQFELERAFSQIHLQETERQKLHAYQRRQQQEELDAKENAQAEVHLTELNVAKARHEAIRQQAEAALQAHIKQEEEERRRREEEQKRLEEEERRRKAEEEARRRAEQERRVREEKERREREEKARAEAERLAIYEKQKAEAEDKRRQEREATEQKERDEKVKADQDAALKKQQQQQQEEDKAAATANAVPPPPLATPAPHSKGQPWSADPEPRHQSYLALHKKLKAFRKDFWEKAKKNPALKPHVGDMRRSMKTSVGQLTDDKVGNKKAVSANRGLSMMSSS